MIDFDVTSSEDMAADQDYQSSLLWSVHLLIIGLTNLSLFI